MGELSSINFKKSNDIQTAHNDRNLPPNYLIGGAFECNRNHEQAEFLKNQIINEAKEIYTQRTKQKCQAKSYEWSAVVNIKDTTTMQDLENLAKHFNDKYGFQCYQIAIHRDEGHINDNGEKVINHHAHLEFVTLDKNTGRNLYNRQNISPKVLREIQSEVAELLQMQRGVDKRLSGAKRIEPRVYAKIKEQERAKIKELKQELTQEHEQENINLKAKNNELEKKLIEKEKKLNRTKNLSLMENFRQLTKNRGFTNAFFKDFNALKREIDKGNRVFNNSKELYKELLKIRKNNPPQNLAAKLQILDKKISKTNQDLGFLSQIEKNYDSEYDVVIQDKNELNKFTELLQAYTPSIDNLENKQEKIKIKEIFTKDIPKYIEEKKKYDSECKVYFFKINLFQAVKKVVGNALEHFKTDKEKLENEIKELNEQKSKEREKDKQIEQLRAENTELKDKNSNLNAKLSDLSVENQKKDINPSQEQINDLYTLEINIHLQNYLKYFKILSEQRQIHGKEPRKFESLSDTILTNNSNLLIKSSQELKKLGLDDSFKLDEMKALDNTAKEFLENTAKKITTAFNAIYLKFYTIFSKTKPKLQEREKTKEKGIER